MARKKTWRIVVKDYNEVPGWKERTFRSGVTSFEDANEIADALRMVYGNSAKVIVEEDR